MSSTIESLPPNLAKIVQRFQKVTDLKRRTEQLIWYGNKLKDFPESEKVPENKVPGCVSQVYIIAHLEDGKVTYQADSDAFISKGMVGLLIEGLNGLSPQEIIQLTPDFIQETGLNVSLTPSRANGFLNIFKTMQKKASEFNS